MNVKESRIIRGRICKIIAGVYLTIITLIMIFNPWFKEMYAKSNILNWIIVALVYISFAIIPLVLEIIADDYGSEFISYITFAWYFLFISSCTIYWIIGPAPTWYLYFLYPIIGTIVNFIPIGISSLLLNIGCPEIWLNLPSSSTYTDTGIQIRNTNTGDTYDVYKRD